MAKRSYRPHRQFYLGLLRIALSKTTNHEDVIRLLKIQVHAIPYNCSGKDFTSPLSYINSHGAILETMKLIQKFGYTQNWLYTFIWHLPYSGIPRAYLKSAAPYCIVPLFAVRPGTTAHFDRLRATSLEPIGNSAWPDLPLRELDKQNFC